MKKWLVKYLEAIDHACMGREQVSVESVDYWQNKLFTNTMKAVLPLSLIATIPGLIYSFSINLYLLSAFDLLSLSIVVWIALGRGISITLRKFILIGVTYVVGTYLLIYIGFKGPGFLYLYAACIFAILILPTKYAYLWSWINVLICGAYTLVVHFKLSPVPEVNAMTPAEWMAIAVNLIFLSFLTSRMVPGLFQGLKKSFNRQLELEQQLRKKHLEQEDTLQKLEVQNSEMEQFVYFASHELKQPVRMVTSFLGLLEKKCGDQVDEKGQQYLDFAIQGGNQMQQLITDLLEYSRTGSQAVKSESVDLSKIVENVLMQQQNTINSLGAKVTYQGLPVVTTDRSLIENVLTNLIANGLKYHREGVSPNIEINGKRQNDEWQILVKDNGIGIPEDQTDRIFDMFVRLHGKAQYEGTGIGLAIVKKCMELLQGKISVESSPGEGSTFRIHLKT
jgi:signal transduction histidine kinase